eukprot:15451156-Alexandrium_andersonii.AAC.1
MAETPRKEAGSPPKMHFRALLGPPPNGRCTVRERSDKATWGAASRCIFAHTTAPAGRRPREGSEGPLHRGVGLPPVHLG